MAEAPPTDEQQIPFLSSASARGRALVLEQTRLLPFPQGATIFKEGDPPEALFVIKSGAVDIIQELMDGTEENQRTLGPGRLLGELGILGGHARTATARAVEPSELWAIERNAFLHLYETESSVGVQIASAMASYLLDAEVVAEDLLFLNLEGRVAKRLLALSESEGTGVHQVTATDDLSAEEVETKLRSIAQSATAAPQPFSGLERLALLSGGSRAAVAGILAEMQRLGFLLATEGELIVTDEPQLEARAKPH